MAELESAAVGAIASDLSSTYGQDHTPGQNKRTNQDVRWCYYPCLSPCCMTTLNVLFARQLHSLASLTVSCQGAAFLSKEQVLARHTAWQQRQNQGSMRAIRESRQQLPIFKFREQITQAIRSHQVVLIAGETGCGKTTQVRRIVTHHAMLCVMVIML